MSVRHFIGYTGRTARRTTARGLLLWSLPLVLVEGCQWVLNDIGAPSDAAEAIGAEDARAADGGTPDGAGSGRERDSGAPWDMPNGGELDAAAESDAAAMEGMLEADGSAGTGGTDAGAKQPDAATLDAETARDSAAAAPDVELSCSDGVWWYEDEDGDGYGRSSARVQACPAPAGRWALQAGDCNDDDPRVHPDQQEYFGAPHRAPDGLESFDYDCSGAEEGNGQQRATNADACGLLLSIALCTGSGYLPAQRAGAPNAWCGSDQKATCQPLLLGALVCDSLVDRVVEPYVCR